MSETDRATEEYDEPRYYEIRIKGHLGARWTDWFEGLSFIHESDGTTILAGLVVDQTALFGLLRKVRDLGLPLLSVMHVDPKQANEPDVNANTDSNRSEQEINR